MKKKVLLANPKRTTLATAAKVAKALAEAKVPVTPAWAQAVAA